MNKTILFAFSALLVLACNSSSIEVLAQDQSAQDGMKSYGAKITPEGAISTAEFAKAIQEVDSMATKLDCEIITSCTVKGCWMDVKLPEGGVMKVKFMDYGFFVPKQGLEGKRAILQGYASRETMSVEMQRHYAEDAGKSKDEVALINEPKHTLFFLAEGVLITE